MPPTPATPPMAWLSVIVLTRIVSVDWSSSVGAAAEAIATVGARAPGAADGLIAGDRAVADGQGGPQDAREAATQPIPAVAAGGSLAADGLIVLRLCCR